MNECDKLHRQAEHYKAEYPSGTQIMLLSMSQNIHRVSDNTRRTVMVVDDIGTLYCRFDNGRQRQGFSPQADRERTGRGAGRKSGYGRG